MFESRSDGSAFPLVLLVAKNPHDGISEGLEGIANL